MPLVKLSRVRVSTPSGVRLHDISWELEARERWAILGENGSGKTSFLRLVRGDTWPDEGHGERIYQLGAEPTASPIEAKAAMAMVSPEQQVKYSQRDWNVTGLQAVAAGHFDSEWLHEEPSAAQWEECRRLLERLRITHLADRRVRQMSSGELRKILVARALVGRPRVLLLDEVAHGLDAESRSDLLRWLDTAVESETALLMATHRLDELPPSVDKFLQLRDGRVEQQGKQRRARAQRASRRRQAKRAAPASGEVLVRIEGADVFAGQTQVLSDISWEIRTGEHWLVQGDNGAGKSTLLKLLAGDVYAVFGARVERFGLSPSAGVWEVKARVGWVSAELQAYYQQHDVSVADVVASGFFGTVGLAEALTEEERRSVDDALIHFSLSALADRRMNQLSYGQARRALLARATVHRPRLLLLDEPFDGLDGANRASLEQKIELLVDQGAQLVLTTHHPAEVPAWITHALRLQEGRIVQSRRVGTP